MTTDPITLILIYDDQKDNFLPITGGEKPDHESNTYLVIDEIGKKITLSFTPTSSLIEKRTIERRVNSFIKTGYNVPGKKGLRIGAGLPLTKVDPKSDELPEILLTHGHTFGVSKLVHDSVPDYIEKERNYEVEEGSAGTKADVTGKFKPKAKSKTKKKSMKKIESKEEEIIQEGKVEQEPIPEPKLTPVSKGEGLLISPQDEHLFILGQFVNMYIDQGFQVLAYKNAEGKFELKIIKEDAIYFIEGNQLFFK